MSGSKTIIEDDDRLNNVHPGDILRLDFLIGAKIPIDEVATGAGIDRVDLKAVLDRNQSIDANMDLRLARYFGMSEGVFLALQIDYDLEEERRAHGHEFDRILPRAA